MANTRLSVGLAEACSSEEWLPWSVYSLDEENKIARDQEARIRSRVSRVPTRRDHPADPT